MPSPSPRPRKRRTREHVIADLAVNHVERQVLRAGHVLERVRYDYGLDLVMYTFDARGEAENGEVYIQVKATENMRFMSDGKLPLLAGCRDEILAQMKGVIRHHA